MGREMNFVCWQVKEQAKALEDRETRDLVTDVANLLHVHDCYLSKDCGKEAWNKQQRDFKTKWFDGSREARLKEYMQAALEEARKECMAMIEG